METREVLVKRLPNPVFAHREKKAVNAHDIPQAVPERGGIIKLARSPLLPMLHLSVQGLPLRPPNAVHKFTSAGQSDHAVVRMVVKKLQKFLGRIRRLNLQSSS